MEIFFSISIFYFFQEPSPAKEVTNSIPPVLEARRNLLSILPRILASLATLWKAVRKSEVSSNNKDPWFIMGQPKVNNMDPIYNNIHVFQKCKEHVLKYKLFLKLSIII